MTAPAAHALASAEGRSRLVWVYQLVLAYFLALRLWFTATVSPMGDEAYYWMWGQHLQLSYLDHPPLHAWLLGLVSLTLGWSPLALRALTWVSLGVSLFVLWILARRAQPAQWQDRFWLAAAVFVSLPVISVATTPAFNDHLLVMFCLAATCCLLIFATDHEAGRTRLRMFYATALLAGLAALTKYNGILLALGFAVFLAVRPQLRSLWRTPHPYVAALVVGVLQLPVLWWNFGADFATLSLHLVERPGGHWTAPDAVGLVRFLAGLILSLGPFFVLGLLLLPRARPEAFDRLQRDLVVTVFVVSSAVLAAASLLVPVLLHWNIVAYGVAGLLGFLVLRQRWLLWPHLALGIYLATVFTWNYSVAPIRVPLFEDGETAKSYGWQDLAAAVKKAQAYHPDAFLAATDYTYAARLGFQLRDAAVTAFGPIPSQYDLWWTPEAHLGQDALIVSDRSYSMATAESQFRTITKIGDVPVYRNGVQIWNFELYLANDYAGPGTR